MLELESAVLDAAYRHADAARRRNRRPWDAALGEEYSRTFHVLNMAVLDLADVPPGDRSVGELASAKK